MVSADCFEDKEVGIEELRAQFQQFQRATHELQKAYKSLKERAASVDRELAETNRALRSRLEERERILQSMPLGVFHQGPEGLMPGNDEGKRLLQDLDGLLAPELCRLVPGDGVARLEIEGKDGRRRNLEVTSLQLGSNGSEVLHFVVDQTEVLSLQEELARLDRIEGLATLSLGVAHEIRNPLNGVRGYASLMRRNPHSERVAQWAENIELGVERVERIVSDLLAFARPEKRGNPKTMSLRSWLRPLLDDFQVSCSEEDGRVLIEADPIAFPTVLENLVRNAKEAGATEVRFERISRRTQWISLLVEDDGSGIPAGWRERVFDPFVTGKSEGTGLGLAFCRKAMESMGGSIVALNDGVPGARFELRVKCGQRGGNA